MVPTLTWGLSRLKFSFAILSVFSCGVFILVSPPEPTKRSEENSWLRDQKREKLKEIVSLSLLFLSS
jgi:hypothetical protein